jgi:hypothetical protein
LGGRNRRVQFKQDPERSGNHRSPKQLEKELADLNTQGWLKGKGPGRQESVGAVRNGRSGKSPETVTTDWQGEDFRSKG